MSRILPLASLAALFAAACEPAPEEVPAEDYSWVLPDQAILVDMPTARRAAGDDSELRSESIDVATHVNTFIGDVLDDIGTITDFQPTWADEDETRALWGPWTDGGVDGALWVQLLDDGSYEWALIGRPEGTTDDDWVPLVAGAVEAGATETTGSGGFVVDFDAIASLDSTSTATGVFATSYDVTETSADAEAWFDDFAENAGDTPVDAGYVYGSDADGGYLDFAYEVDYTGSGIEETIILRSRWVPGGAGRGDAYVTGGDFGALVYQASECWDEAGVVVYDENNADFTTTGDPSLCVFAQPEWNEDV